MRHLRVLNLVCSHRNVRFLTKTLQRSGLFVRVWRAYGRTFFACVVRVHVILSVLARVARHDQRTCKNEM